VQQFLLQNFNVVIVAAMLTMVFCLVFRPLAIKISLVDKPDQRKKHDFNTPLTGGICVFVASVLSLLIFSESLSNDLTALNIGLGLMLVLGVVDDQFELAANTKLFSQIAVVTSFVISCDCAVTNLGQPLGFAAPINLDVLSLPFTVLAIVGLTNAFNMIDGCDGLATSLVMISLLALSYFGYAVVVGTVLNYGIVVLSSLVVFLFFNFSNSKDVKTFLGDGGSLFLGFFVAVSMVEFADSSADYDPSVVLWFAGVPILDLCAVVARRTLLKRRITAADRSHIHHYILSKGLSHFQTTIVISAAAVALLFFGVFVSSNYPSLSVLSFLIIFIIYLSFRILAGKFSN
jgi:UDP-GlcNAc:undecaprenyl-phosphate GlcNAc-1-phosphate transferase